VRENLRKYKKMPLLELLDRSINQTLSRTILTSVTTLLALLALFLFGGPVIRGFTVGLIWGVCIGTYSSVALAVPLLANFNVRGQTAPGEAGAEAEGEEDAATDEPGKGKAAEAG
ncbi:MAG: protein translocase subunit SecF, partial [Kiloniellales bacterium]|nr:protein translocase subunit SecF [Kiloniellales bacterium]